MTKSPVWYVDRSVWPRYSMLDKLEVLWKKSGLQKAVQKDHRVIIKTHFGNFGNLMHLRPALLRKMVDLVKSRGAHPILAESAGLGYGPGVYGNRTTAAEYFRMAAYNGFTLGSMGAPIILLDGYWGTDTFEVKIKGKHLKKVEVGMALRDADIIIVFTHFKGHGLVGMGGALKNMGIGCVGKYSKAMMHGPLNPIINPEECKGKECSLCIRVCPTRCITVDPKVAIDRNRCIKCLHCGSVCRGLAKSKAIYGDWSSPPREQTERMIENVLGVLEGVGRDRFFFINAALDISEMCDCVSFGPQAIVPDLGIFAARDPIAIDAATLDILDKAKPVSSSICENLEEGEDKFAVACGYPDPETGKQGLTDTHHLQLEYGEKMGLGTRDYELKHVDKKREKPQNSG
ncbi:MAG: DUF362 domain-containing protein [Promethearchaeota archaeon]